MSNGTRNAVAYRTHASESDQPPIPSIQPQAKSAHPPSSDLSLGPTMKPEVAQPAPARPYKLDELISDRAKAEADLDSMMSEIRGRMKGR